MTARIPNIRSVLFAIAGVSAVFAADPMPYDSIGNPLNALPATNPNIQRIGDSLNLLPNRVRVNQAGYRQIDVAAGYAKFYYVGTAAAFDVVSASGAKVASGALSPKGGVTVSGQINPTAANSAEHANGGNGDWKKGYPMTGTKVSGSLMQGVLPATLPAGKYTIRVGADSSVPFIVSDNVYSMARDAALKFFGVARSGDYESWFHPPSHMWDGWLYDSAARNPDGSYKYKGALKGGWYDCGNHLKEARTNSYPLATLGMLAATMIEKDADRYALNQGVTLKTDGIPDVLREAWVGAQFVFNSYRLAKGKVGDMILSVGDPGPDFGWWGRPENHDAVLSPRRGGRKERVLLKNWGSGSMGDFAAGMAFLGRLYRPYDPVFADSALTIAKQMYEVAKTTNLKEAAPDYSGDAVLYDDLALAAVSLLWATQDTRYLDELAYAPGMPNGATGTCGNSGYGQGFETTRFPGGYMGCGSDGMTKNGGPTDYGSVNSLVLYSFAKLILSSADTAAHYGIGPAQRDTLLLRCINAMPGTYLGQGNATISLPVGGQYDQPRQLSYDSIWYSMGQGFGKTGWWNKYQFGNLADLYMYYDMTSLVDQRPILNKPGTPGFWKRQEVLQVLLGGLNYMFGTNALDISYLYGIGRKNPMHPHHRAANPEGKNVPGAYYNYTIPVGGLYGGLMTGPTNTEVLKEYFDTPVQQTEANCPDAQAVVLIPLMGLASEAPNGPPMPKVKVLYTTDTLAVIQVDLDKWGWVKLGYGLDSSMSTQAKAVFGPDTGNTVRISIGGLSPATQYYFHVVSTDLLGQFSIVGKSANGKNDSVPFSFTTKAVPPVPPRFGNIKVCNVTSDSAEIMWYTPNGEYLSSVLWADSASWKIGSHQVTDSDMVGAIPVKFHHVKLHGLSPKTTYNFRVGVPGSYDPLVGCFRTPNEDVKFEIKTTHYNWGGQPAMGIGVINQDVKDYDSLQIRLYVNGTASEILDLAARVDIAFKYRADGFIDSGLFAYTKDVSKSRPRLIDPSCPAATTSCAWYFDLPLHGATMETQSRWRLDVIFDRHLLERDSNEILSRPPTHDPFAVGGQDWSFRPHVAGGDNGLSPVAYGGVPLMDKEDIDNKTMDIPVNPYIAVYRKGEFVYGFSPFAKEQATKRTVFAMNATFAKPFGVSNGNTIEIGTGTSTRLKGDLDPYDVMMPSVKGYITAIWVNGVALSDAERKSALARQPDGTWKVDLPLRFVAGTNKLDVTFFAGSDSVDDAPAGTCDEGKGCTFYNANWYVNYVSNMTPSILSVVDAAENPVGLVVPDSSTLRIRVKDGNANLSKTALDVVTVSVTNSRTKGVAILSLAETGANTGVFQTDLLKTISPAASTGQLQTIPGDTLVVRYMDAADSADVGEARIWSKTLWPNLVSAVVSRTCGGTGTVSAVLDGKLGSSGTTGPEILQNAGFESPVAPSSSAYYNYSGVLGAWNVSHVDIVTDGALGGLIAPEEGRQYLDLNDIQAGGIWQVVNSAPGKNVRLSFLYSVNAGAGGTGPTVVKASITVNGRALDTLEWNKSTEAASWKSATYDFVSTGRDSIDFRSLVAGNQGIVLDDVSLKLASGSGSIGAALQGGSVVLLGANGDTLHSRALSVAELAIGADGKTVRLDVPASATAGLTGGTLGLVLDAGNGKMVTTTAAIADGVGPWVDSAKIVENLSGSPVDTLFVWTSEAVQPFGKNLPVLVSRSGAVVPVAGATVEAADLVDASTGKWRLAIRGGVVKAKDSLRWSPALVADANGNAALDCPSLAREVELVSRPAPFVRAWIEDVDGDGRADLASMVYRKILVASDLPDSVQIGFGAAGSVRRVPVSMADATDSVLRIPLALPFLLSETRGSSLDGSGSLLVWKSGDATGPYALLDSVGPVLLAASLRFGDKTDSDTLELSFSEPVDSASGLGWLAHRSGFDLGGRIPSVVSGATWRYPIPAGVVAAGDSVKPLPAHRWIDAAAMRHVPAGQPWIPVTGGERPPLFGWYLDADSDGAVDRVQLRFAKPPMTRPGFALSLGATLVRIDSGSWAMDASGTTASVAVGPLDRGLTAFGASAQGTWMSMGRGVDFPLHDSADPVLISALLKYASDDSVPDTLQLRWSEAIVRPALAGPVVHGSRSNRVALAGAAIASEGVFGASLLVWADSMGIVRGDSAQLDGVVSGVSDLFGNVPGPDCGWVAIQFGVRPIRLDFKLRTFLETPAGLVLPTMPSLSAMVRARPERGASDTAWTRLDGFPAPQEPYSIHVTMSINREIEGGVYLFDNLGVFVGSIDLAVIKRMAEAGTLPVDGSGMYQVRLAWDGRDRSGRDVASGVYWMRLVLKDQVDESGQVRILNRVFGLGVKRTK